MRCSCPVCGTYMIQAESVRLGCVCPECGAHCADCLGTNTVISRETIRNLKNSDWFTPQFSSDMPGTDIQQEETPQDVEGRPEKNGW